MGMDTRRLTMEELGAMTPPFGIKIPEDKKIRLETVVGDLIGYTLVSMNKPPRSISLGTRVFLLTNTDQLMKDYLYRECWNIPLGNEIKITQE